METTVDLASSAWFGDSSISIDFPSSWEVVSPWDGGPPPLSPDEIRRKVSQPIGSEPLATLASGKQRVVIIVDDITRPTPAKTILPFVLEALRGAGVRNDSVTVIVGGGTHALPTEEEIRKKIGEELAARIRVLTHDPGRDLVFLGKTARGTPVHLNRAAAESDLLIGVGCIYPHPAAGFSGGSKIVAPGVCGSETARNMHDYLRAGERGRIDGRNEFRCEIEEIARRAGLRFIVNVVLNQNREACGVFSGDREAAHREGVDFARAIYSVPPVEDPDVVIVDSYPFDTTFQFAHDRSLWQFAGLGKNVSKVIVAACPAGMGSHELYPLVNPLATRFARRIRNIRIREFRNYAVKIRALKKIWERKRQEYLIFSAGLSGDDLRKVYPGARLFRKWEEIRKELESRHKKGHVKVCIYRCSPFLLPV